VEISQQFEDAQGLQVEPAILILKQIADFARPAGAQNPQSVAVQGYRRRACTATDLHNENY
jgi:hypothetical protein